MTSREKIVAMIDELSAGSDSDLREALPFPVPVSVVRMAIDKLDQQIPDDVDELDGLLEYGAQFLLSLRSDTVELADVPT